jgi:hypothetical protein
MEVFWNHKTCLQKMILNIAWETLLTNAKKFNGECHNEK